MARALSSFPIARQFLIDALGALRAGDRVCSVREAAGRAGVSHVTMWKAMRSLRQEGVLSGGAAGYTAAGGSAATEVPKPVAVPSPAPKPVSIATAVTDSLRSEIVSGRHGFGERLLSVKELRSRAGISRPTLTKALRTLESQGFIERAGRWYRIPALTVRPSVRIAVVLHPRQVSPQAQVAFNQELIHCIESECTAGRIGFTLAYMRAQRDGSLRVDVPQGGIDGVVYCANLPESADDRAMRCLAGLQKPIAVFDHVGMAVRARTIIGARARCFSITLGQDAGAAVGEYLYRLGHRTVAYISPWHGRNWSVRRCEGLLSYLSPRNGKVHVFASEETAVPPFRYETEMVKIRQRIDRYLEELPHEIRFAIDPLFDSIFTERYLFGEVYLESTPLFSRAFASPEITAWVCANDALALMALDFLKRRQGGSKRSVAVMGFDDTPEGMRAGLTSYNFGIPFLASAMLQWILWPRSRTDVAQNTRGYVVHRSSSRQRNRPVSGPVSG